MVQHGRILCGLLIWFHMLYIHEGECQIVCPRVVELYTTTFLTCKVSSGSGIIYVTPSGNIAATCISNRPQCISRNQFVRFKGTVVNSTHSYLQIKDVQKSDEGMWVCEDQKSKIGANKSCNLVISDTPSCNVTSDRNIEELYVGDDLSLSAHIGDYYCSLPAGFHLKTGNTTIELTRIDGNVLNSTFMLKDSHFGSVKLLFECNNVTKIVTCGNIQNLVKRDKDLDDVEDLDGVEDDKQIVIIAVTVVAVIITVVILSLCIVKRSEILKCLTMLLPHSRLKASVKHNSNHVTHDSETGFVSSVGDSKMVADVNCASVEGEEKGGLNLASTGLPESRPMLPGSQTS